MIKFTYVSLSSLIGRQGGTTRAKLKVQSSIESRSGTPCVFVLQGTLDEVKTLHDMEKDFVLLMNRHTFLFVFQING